MYRTKKNDDTKRETMGELGEITGSFQNIEKITEELKNPEPMIS